MVLLWKDVGNNLYIILVLLPFILHHVTIPTYSFIYTCFDLSAYTFPGTTTR